LYSHHRIRWRPTVNDMAAASESMRGMRWRWQRIVAVMRIETLRVLRDPPTMALIVAVPAIQILLFGGAINLDPKGLGIAIGHDPGVNVSALAQEAEASGYVRVVDTELPRGEAERALRRGRVALAIELNPGEAPRLLADGSDPSAVRPAVLALQSVLQRHALSSLTAGVGLSPYETELQRLAPRIEWLYNPAASTTWAITPGLVGVVVMITMLLLGALTLVRERELGSWETLLTTPVDGFDALVGKLSPYVIIGVLQAAVVIALGYALFNVPVRGSITLLLVAAAFFAAAHLILGFALSALASTQIQAVQAAVFFYLPSMLLSGFMFPFEGMPGWARALGECIPLTHFVRIARGVMLRGAGGVWVLAEIWPVALFAALATALALAAYRRRLS
jgi:ABC-2 type transport system permease protein